METRNLAELYDLAPLDWSGVAAALDAGFPQAPGSGGPDRHTCWLVTIDPDGRPHVTPLLGVWSAGALYFTTGATERKARNLAHNAQCILTTGCNTLDGLDLVVEGQAARVSDAAERRTVADAYEAKYGAHFTAPEGTWFGLGDAIRNDDVVLLRVMPAKVFGFGKGKPFSQTRYRFA